MDETRQTPRERWWASGGCRGEEYEAAMDAREAAGQYLHGEADFMERLGARSILDAGCGTGRIARELVRRGFEVVGVDIAAEMLAVARRKAPDLDWRLGDLATVQLDRQFEAVLLAGNVMIFLAPNSEGAVLANLARHLRVGGFLVAGFQLLPHGLTAERYDALASAAGLELVERWATWERQPWHPGADYYLSVHRRTG